MLQRLVPQRNPLSKPLHFIFIACNRNPLRFHKDPSFIYRCENLGAALECAGYRVSYCHLSNALLMDSPDVVIFHRPSYSYLFFGIFSWFKSRGVTLIADIDDLIFDPCLANYSPGVLNDLVPLKIAKRKFLANFEALNKFDAITVSTEPLATHLQRCFPKVKVEVISNAVHHSWVGNERCPLRSSGIPGLKTKNLKEQLSPVVTYFPGTRSHDLDFSIFASGVEAFLDKYPQATFDVTGPLEFEMSARSGQIIHREKLPFELYHQRFSNAWVNLAPLQATPFTQCKSALKVLEAGYWGVPTICSPLPDAERFRNRGALAVVDAQDCFKQLDAMMDPRYYYDMTDDLSARVLAIADVEKKGQQFLHFVKLIA